MVPAQQQRPAQQQQQSSGSQSEEMLQPNIEKMMVQGSEMLLNKVALIVGGDSDLGRAVAIA
ncbi:MAG: NAD(P)-dependent oxidoreductase, partial [Cyanobacteriota bacterium]